MAVERTSSEVLRRLSGDTVGIEDPEEDLCRLDATSGCS